LEIPSFKRFRNEIFGKRAVSSLEDRRAPSIAAPAVRGGTRVLSDQAACPFRAFARWRLRAEPLEAPTEGLDAAQRGTLLHELMKHLWSSLKDSSALDHYLEPFIENAAEAAVKELGVEGRFAELERARLARLAREWLEVERSRAPFAVHSLEEKRTLKVGPLELSARIDRMDRLEGGGHVLIDYKTSRAPSPKHWEPPRPDDPQLPVYAVSVEEDIAAVAFAKVRPGDMKFMGFSEEEGAVPGVKPAKAWKPLLKSWKDEALRLASGFAAGEAEVDPKRGLQTCRHCDLHTLCRVYEKLNTLEEQQDANGEGAGP
jgi:probable DNA repair protein